MVAEKVLLALEALLPDICLSCDTEYCVDRTDSPSLKCMRCLQGVREECLQGVAGLADLFGPQEGSLGALSFTCKHCLTRKLPGRSNRAPATPTPPPPVQQGQQGHDVQVLPPQVHQEEVVHAPEPPPLPHTDEVSAIVADTDSDSSRNTNFSQRICEAFKKGICPHGASGKTGGNCSDSHPKRCPAFLKWGSKHTDHGCSGSDCGKLHPVMCPRSDNQLQCFNKNCPYKLHAQKCEREAWQKQGNRGGHPHQHLHDQHHHHQGNRY